MVEREVLHKTEAGSSVPIPDPTILTTQALQREIFTARELVELRVESLREILTSKYDGALNSINLIEDRINVIIDRNRHELIDIKHFYDEKIQSVIEAMAVMKNTINERFTLADVQTEKAARDVKSAVDAAFAAAKEAVGEQNKSNALSITKSESAFTKQIDQLVASIAQIVKNTDDKIESIKINNDSRINDIKDRIIRMEGRSSISDPGIAEAIKSMSDNISTLRSTTDSTGGHVKGIEQSWTFFLSVSSILLSLVMVIIVLSQHHVLG
jgi:hypothetical protein